MNVAVGGWFFPDGATNPHPKPWSNGSPTVILFYFFIINTAIFFVCLNESLESVQLSIRNCYPTFRIEVYFTVC